MPEGFRSLHQCHRQPYQGRGLFRNLARENLLVEIACSSVFMLLIVCRDADAPSAFDDAAAVVGCSMLTPLCNP